jgi:hypothetical protein
MDVKGILYEGIASSTNGCSQLTPSDNALSLIFKVQSGGKAISVSKG